MSRRLRSRPLALCAAVLGLALLAGCGSRLDTAQVAVASGAGDTVTLTEDSLEALRAGTLAPAAAADAPAEFTADVAEANQTERSEAAPSPARAAAAKPGAAATATAGPSRQAAAAQPKARPQARAAVATKCPTNLEPIVVGHVGGFSGIAGPITGSAPTTMAAWVAEVNARGGLACHRVKVITRDDGGDPNRSAAIVNDLVKRHRVVAFVGPETILSSAGFVPAVRAAKVPVVGGTSVVDAWFSEPLFFPAGSSADDQVIGVLRHGVERGKAKVGVLYCVESSTCTGVVKLVRDAAGTAGATLLYDAAVSITQPDFTAQCLNAQKAGVDQLVLAVDGASMTRVARSCAAVGYRPLVSTAAGAIGTSHALDETLRSFGVVTANTTAPWTQKDRPGLREYHAALARWAPTLEPDGASISAWASAKLFETAVEKVAGQARRGPVTSDVLLAGLGAIRKETLGGLVVPLTFAAGQPHATSPGCVFYQLLDERGWTAPRGSAPVCGRR